MNIFHEIWFLFLCWHFNLSSFSLLTYFTTDGSKSVLEKFAILKKKIHKIILDSNRAKLSDKKITLKLLWEYILLPQQLKAL